MSAFCSYDLVIVSMESMSSKVGHSLFVTGARSVARWCRVARCLCDLSYSLPDPPPAETGRAIARLGGQD